MASMLARQTSNFHHPDTLGDCMPPPSTMHTLVPFSSFCLLPPGTPDFLVASSTHKSANPLALLTASPQRERDREGVRETAL